MLMPEASYVYREIKAKMDQTMEWPHVGWLTVGGEIVCSNALIYTADSPLCCPE